MGDRDRSDGLTSGGPGTADLWRGLERDQRSGDLRAAEEGCVVKRGEAVAASPIDLGAALCQQAFDLPKVADRGRLQQV